MSSTSTIVSDLHNTGKTHRPIAKILMTYANKEGVKVVNLLDMSNGSDRSLLTRTVSWAAHNGVEIILRPV